MGKAGVLFEPLPSSFENFDISTGFRFSKISVECSIHSCSCPWSNMALLATMLRLARTTGQD